MIRSAQLLMLSFALSACSSGGGGGDSGGFSGGGGSGGGGSGGGSETAQFFDSLVEGLEYSSSNDSGVTDVNGYFDYTPGQETTFKVGDIVLGSLIPSRVVSPVEFLGDDESFDENPKALNIARFLQTIDEDDFPLNGITISSATRAAAMEKSINFDQSSDAWENDAEVISTIASLTTNSIVSESEARSHVLAWIAASRAGEYGGTYSSALFSGDWRMSVSTAGEVIIIANYVNPLDGEIGDFGGSGVIDGTDGSFSVTTVFAQFHGAVIGTEVSGWFSGTGDYSGIDGTISGDLEVQPMTFLDLELLEHYEDLDGEIIFGSAHDDDGFQSANFLMFLGGDQYGRYEVSMDVDADLDLQYEGKASFYVTDMTSNRINFSGLCTSGEGFSGQLSPTGEVSGTYYNLYADEDGGSFSGQL